MNKTQQKKFKTGIEKLLQVRGAHRVGGDEWLLPTPAGVLEVTVFDTWIAGHFRNGYLSSVWSRSALNRIIVNGSHKWNHHYRDCAPELAIADFTLGVDDLLDWQPSEADLLLAANLEIDYLKYQDWKKSAKQGDFYRAEKFDGLTIFG